MNIQIKRTAHILLDPNSMIFGVAVFNLILVWLRSPEWHFHRNVFMAVLLIVSAILLLLNTSWSNLMAAILSGYLPIELLNEYWMIAHYAEVPVFSYRHFSCFFLRIEIEGSVLLSLTLTLMILARAVFAVMRSRRLTANDA
ncbi:MAG TPA: hypothetical protein VJM50_22075 [Pyrinomonadaceae bacterium]|nr:hypothetical protein [Pyrinomonadaceae bacterium]